MTRVRTSVDFLVASALGIGSFILLYVRYWFPSEKIFDEVYFARAAEEYLQRRYIYESTHPPLTKLLITLSTLLFGGLAKGDTSYGWRFLDVVAGAIAVVLVYALARRILGSPLFAAYAAVLFGLDGMHFVQSRIATPESFVVCFSLATLYAFCRYWDAVVVAEATTPKRRVVVLRLAALAVAFALAAAFSFIRWSGDALYARITVAIPIACGLYATYALYRRRPAGTPWLLFFAFSGAALVASKWYGVMAYGVAAVVMFAVWIRAYRNEQPNPFPVEIVITTAIAAIGIVYALAYIPHFAGLRDLQTLPPRPYTLTNVVDMQVGAYKYHSTLVATHPYASEWWSWPLDLRPILYYANYSVQDGVGMSAMIYSLPNPLLLWPGLFAVPFVAYLAWVTRNRGYALIVLAYLLQWLPWARSPRIAWEYHFYVDIPLIAICNAAAMQWIYERLRDRQRIVAIGIPLAYLAIVAAAFVFFYPIYAGLTITNDARIMRMWLPSWV